MQSPNLSSVPQPRHGPGLLLLKPTMGIILLVTTVMCLLGWVQKSPCLPGKWTNDLQYTTACYTDVAALYGAEGLNQGKVPYFDPVSTDETGTKKYVEYPVGIGLLMWVGAEAAHIINPGEAGASSTMPTFFNVSAIILTGFALLTAWACARLSGKNPWAGFMVALSPLLAFHSFINWDLAVMGLVAVAIYLWAARNPLWAGVFIGLGTATKLFPALLLIPLLALCLRSRRMREYWITVAGAVVAWLVLDLPVWLGAPEGFATFWNLNKTRGADWDSIFMIWEHGIGQITWPFGASPDGHIASLNFWTGALMVLTCAGLLAMILWAPTMPRLPQVCFIIVAMFLLTNKVYSPQYCLWLLPLAVLARPKWLMLLAWQFAEILEAFTRFRHFHALSAGGHPTYWDFATTIAIRDLILMALIALVVVDIFHPKADVVRVDGLEEPCHGVLDPAAPPWRGWRRKEQAVVAAA